MLAGGGVLQIEEVDLELARRLIAVARRAIELYMEHEDEDLVLSSLSDHVKEDPRMGKKAAVFVTLEKISGTTRMLRGCIGFIVHHLELAKAVIGSAISSAFKDPRFKPLARSELGSIAIEIALLGPRIPIKGPGDIVIGRDAIYVESIYGSGILLPQVPIDYCWDEETFLGETCLKAGLDLACWLRRGVTTYRIPGRVFYEREPLGEVVERDLVGEYKLRCRGP